MNDETYNQLAKAVHYAARATQDEWPGVVEADDVEQDIWVRLLESPGSAERLADMNDRDRKVSLNKIGRQLAIEERSSYEWFSAQVHYSTDDVREMLEAGALVNEGFNGSDERMDFEAAITEVRESNPQYIESLWEHYEMGTYDTDTGGARRRLGTAVRKLTNHMNGSQKTRNENYIGPGSRKAISNEDARYITDNVWEVPSA